MGKLRYTRELLEPLVKESLSMAQVIRKLGLREAGGTHSYLSKKIRELEINTSHFLGQAYNKGKTGKDRKGGPDKKEWHEILILRESGNRTKSIQLRRALKESGREYVCEECGLGPEWNGKKLRLQVDHKNSDWLDDRPENVRFLCPNCHTQTPSYNKPAKWRNR